MPAAIGRRTAGAVSNRERAHFPKFNVRRRAGSYSGESPVPGQPRVVHLVCLRRAGGSRRTPVAPHLPPKGVVPPATKNRGPPHQGLRPVPAPRIPQKTRVLLFYPGVPN